LFIAAAAVRDLVVFVAVTDLLACTTAQLPVVQRNVFFPPAVASWTTGCAVDVQVQRALGQLGPA
jgi:hypothetical protein